MNRTTGLSTATWRESTYGDGGDDNCVEVADGHPGIVPVRDGKTPTGPVLVIGAPAWTAFVATVRA